MGLSKTAFQLLETLGDGHFHSGEALGQKLNITRSAIWKAFQQLRTYQINVESITGKGYRLNPPLELLNPEKIKTHLTEASQAALDRLELFTEIDSTSEYLLKKAKATHPESRACFSECQTKGRGRRGRHWASPFGTNIYLSLLWHFNQDPSEIAGLSLAVAVAIKKALDHYGIPEGIELKWPNDILWKGQKLAGNSLEMIAEPHQQCHVVIGVGLNTEVPQHIAAEITQPWADIATITSARPERNRLAACILNALIECAERFSEKGLAPFLPEWRNSAAMLGEKVILHTPQGNIEGIMQDISDRGELVLLNEHNEKQHFFSGEVSLRRAETKVVD